MRDININWEGGIKNYTEFLISNYKNKKLLAVFAHLDHIAKKHQTQKKDFERLLRLYETVSREDRFILFGGHKKEKDLFENID